MAERPSEIVELPLDVEPLMGATISPCGNYRYDLWRRWGPGPVRAYVMLNPSTADDALNDPTIVRCIGFAQRDGFDGISVRNLFAYRTPSPKVLKEAFKRGFDVIGPENDDWLRNLTADGHESVIAAWGRASALPKRMFGNRSSRVVDILSRAALSALDPHPFRGSAPHPLYLKDDTPIVPYPAMGKSYSGSSDGEADRG